jgi:hypothetical protein
MRSVSVWVGWSEAIPNIGCYGTGVMGIASLHPTYFTKNPTPIATTLNIIAAVDSQPSQ